MSFHWPEIFLTGLWCCLLRFIEEQFSTLIFLSTNITEKQLLGITIILSSRFKINSSFCSITIGGSSAPSLKFSQISQYYFLFRKLQSLTTFFGFDINGIILNGIAISSKLCKGMLKQKAADNKSIYFIFIKFNIII